MSRDQNKDKVKEKIKQGIGVHADSHNCFHVCEGSNISREEMFIWRNGISFLIYAYRHYKGK